MLSCKHQLERCHHRIETLGASSIHSCLILLTILLIILQATKFLKRNWLCHSYYKDWLGNPANFKGTNKDQKIYVGRSTTLHNLLFCAHTLWLNYVTVTFLLVSSSGTNHELLCLCRVRAKKANKNIEQRILPSFLTIYLY